ncbi:MAG: ATP synthase F1 subunit delta [Gemmataceae bacterium]
MSDNSEPLRLETTSDVTGQRIARVYAEALLQAAENKGQADEVQDELEALIRDVFQRDPTYRRLVQSDVMNRDRGEALIRKVFQGRINDLLFNFFLVLNKRGRFELLQTIAAEYRALRDERAHRRRVLVTSAVPLPDEQRARIVETLRSVMFRQPVVDYAVDPSLLGGLVIKGGDFLFDGSVRTRIEHLCNDIMARSSYEIQSRRDRFSSG